MTEQEQRDLWAFIWKWELAEYPGVVWRSGLASRILKAEITIGDHTFVVFTSFTGDGFHIWASRSHYTDYVSILRSVGAEKLHREATILAVKVDDELRSRVRRSLNGQT